MGRNPPQIFYPMWMVLLSNVDNTKTSSWYARYFDYTYSAVTDAFKMLYARGLIWKEDKGREKIIKLTEKGEKIARPLKKHIMEMKRGTGIEIRSYQNKHTTR